MKKVLFFFLAFIASVTAFAQSRVTALDQLSNSKTYLIHAENGYGYLCYAPQYTDTYLYVWGATNTNNDEQPNKYKGELDMNDVNNHWQILNEGGNYYLYNVGAQKYAKLVGELFQFTDEATPVTVTGGNTFAFAAQGSGYVCMAINHWATYPVRGYDSSTPMIVEEIGTVGGGDPELAEMFAEMLETAKTQLESGTKYIKSGNLYTDPNQFYSAWTDPTEGSEAGCCDGNPNTYWHSTWQNGKVPPGTHDFFITLPEAVGGEMQLSMTRRNDAMNDHILAFDVYVSANAQAKPDGEGFEFVGTVQTPWGGSASETVTADFKVPEGTKQIRFVIAKTDLNRGYGHFAEFQLYTKNLDPECYNALNPKAAAAFAEAIAVAERITQPTEDDILALYFAAEAYAEGDQPEAEPYPVNFDKDSDATRTDRYLNGVNITVDGGEKQSVSISSRKPYVDMSGDESAVFTCKPGERLTATFNYTGSWMNGYVYIDEDNDKQFSFNEGNTDQSGTELKTFSFYSGDFNQDERGVNSEGQIITGNNRDVLNPPSFVAPQQPGEYRIRFKVDWNSVDPGGQIAADGTCTGPNGILKNGGVIFDATLRVVEVDPMPQAGKAYFIRTESFGTSNDVYYVGVGEQPETEPVAWLCSVDENGMYSFMNETGDVLHFRGWEKGGTAWGITPMTKLTAGDMNQESLPAEYVKPEVVVMQGYHSDGRFIYLNVNFANGNYDHGGNVFAPWNSSYNSFFVFEETEVFEPIIEWNGEINVKEEAATIDELLEYPVEFKKAQGLSVSPFGLLGAIFNESGDIYAIAFAGQNYEQFGGVEVKGSTFNVQFEKVADIKDELKESVIQKIGGFKPAAGVATVYFCPKSFVFDGATYGESLKWEYTLAGSGTPTGIESVGTDNAADVIYDLQGRRVVAPVKGNLYIQNGKKVMK